MFRAVFQTSSILLIVLLNFSCGIKGKPSTPLEPPWIGRGSVEREEKKNRKGLLTAEEVAANKKIENQAEDDEKDKKEEDKK